MTTLKHDVAARARALDPAGSFLVEALAGSGKTSLLAQRLLVLLARVDEPESVLAVTFTRKAVEELRARVLDALESVDHPEPTAAHAALTWRLAAAVRARDTARGWQLLARPARLRIQTIDALAGSLVSRLPVSVGAAASFIATEDNDDLYTQAARETLASLEDPDYGALVAPALAVLDNDWPHAELLLKDLLPRREQWLRRVVGGPSRAAAELALSAAIALELSLLPTLLAAPYRASLSDFVRQVGSLLQQQDPDNASAGALAGFDFAQLNATAAGCLAELLLTKEGEPRKIFQIAQGVPALKTREFKDWFAEVRDLLSDEPDFCAYLQSLRALPDARYSDAEWTSVEALLKLLQLAAGTLDLVFSEHQRCDFTHVAAAAQRALGSPDAPTDFALAFDYQLEHLLVDEFQDTSRSQFEFFKALVGGWTGNDGRTLFLVGDPLQSIYRFRQAEVGLFRALQRDQRFGDVPLERLALSANFRTVEPLIDWLNAALPVAFAGAAKRLPAFNGLVATRAALDAAAVRVYPVYSPDSAAEAHQVFEIICAIRARRPEASIGVLVRSRAHLGGLPALLAASGIPVAASDVEPMLSVPIVNDLLALTRALMHASDSTAWLAVLRAPWCGVSLTALLTLSTAADGAPLCSVLDAPAALAQLAADDRVRVSALNEVLALGMAQARRLPWAWLVERVWLDLQGPALVAGDDLRCAGHYFELLAAFEQRTPDFSPAALQAFVSKRFAPVPRTDGTPVNLMTIHRAKGLEFDVVILPGLNRKVGSDARAPVVWHDHDHLPDPRLLVAPRPPPGSAPGSAYDFVRRLEGAEQAAENRRLLYVAMTRARDELHLCARLKPTDNGSVVKPIKNSFLSLLWPHVAGDFGAAKPWTTPLTPAVPARAWLRIATLSLPPPGGLPAVLAGGEAELVFDWATPVAKHIGTVTHLLLQLMAEAGGAAWRAADVAASRGFIEGELRARGLAAAALPAATARCLEALTTTLNSTRGRWILSADHHEAASEYRLSGVLDGQLTQAVIDRTFVTAQGVRWIIDFKTGEHLGGSREAFMDSEVVRYQSQLARYAKMFSQLDSRPIYLALYFPLLDGWREWAYVPPNGE